MNCSCLLQSWEPRSVALIVNQGGVGRIKERKDEEERRSSRLCVPLENRLVRRLDGEECCQTIDWSFSFLFLLSIFFVTISRKSFEDFADTLTSLCFYFARFREHGKMEIGRNPGCVHLVREMYINFLEHRV